MVPTLSGEVQHLRLWEHVTYVKFWKYRVVCPTCGVKAEQVSWVQSYGRVTWKLAHLVRELCKVMTNQAVGLLLWLHPGTVKQIDKRGLQAPQKARALDGIRTLGVDEIAVGKGHQYWHLVHALDGPRGPELLFVGEGRKEKDLEKFWRWFGKRRAKKITHAVMDMWSRRVGMRKASARIVLALPSSMTSSIAFVTYLMPSMRFAGLSSARRGVG